MFVGWGGDYSFTLDHLKRFPDQVTNVLSEAYREAYSLDIRQFEILPPEMTEDGAEVSFDILWPNMFRFDKYASCYLQACQGCRHLLLGSCRRRMFAMILWTKPSAEQKVDLYEPDGDHIKISSGLDFLLT